MNETNIKTMPQADRDEAMKKIEERVWTEYTAALNKIVLVRALNGFKGNDSGDYVLEPPARVRVGKTAESAVKRWDLGGENWCDPYWEVTLVEPHPQLVGVRSMWIHATSYLLGSDRTEQSDVVEILGDAPVSPYEVLEGIWDRYDFGTDASYEDSGGWSHDGAGEWTRPVYLKPRDVSVENFDIDTSEKVTFTVRLNPDLSVADAYVITKDGNMMGRLTPDETQSGRVVNAAEAAIKAHKEALLIEGNDEIQVYHLLASLREHCARKGLDLDAIHQEVRDAVVSGEIQSPLWKARQLALRRAS